MATTMDPRPTAAANGVRAHPGGGESRGREVGGAGSGGPRERGAVVEEGERGRGLPTLPFGASGSLCSSPVLAEPHRASPAAHRFSLCYLCYPFSLFPLFLSPLTLPFAPALPTMRAFPAAGTRQRWGGAASASVRAGRCRAPLP